VQFGLYSRDLLGELHQTFPHDVSLSMPLSHAVSCVFLTASLIQL